VRMRSRDIIALYDTVGRGARVFIEDAPLAAAAQPLLARGATSPSPAVPAAADSIGAGNPPMAAAPAIGRSP
jgi:hypothetical protein